MAYPMQQFIKPEVIQFSRMFSTDSAKAIKASGYGYLNGINYMAPFDFAGKGTVCPNASEGCKALCLGLESGQAAIRKEGGTNKTVDSRVRKTRYFFAETQTYLCELVWHIHKLINQAAKQNLTPVVRLNGSSDIPYERFKVRAYGNKTILEIFPNVQFVDYTKNLDRLTDNVPANLDLTFSLHEENHDEAVEAIRRGFNVAAIFADFLPRSYDLGNGSVEVIDGDKHDLRFLDPKTGVIVGLTPKGRKAKADDSGMVIRDHIDILRLAA